MPRLIVTTSYHVTTCILCGQASTGAVIVKRTQNAGPDVAICIPCIKELHDAPWQEAGQVDDDVPF